MKSKMRKKLIAFMLCMVLVICNSVSILADTPAPETKTTQQVKETKTVKEEKASEESKTAAKESGTSEQSEEEKAPEVKTTAKKEATTKATTESTKATTEAAEETTTEAKEDKTEATTEAAEETSTTEGKEETSQTSEEDKEENNNDKDTESVKQDEKENSEETAEITKYDYKSDEVNVTVTLTNPEDLPDDAELVVTPITLSQEAEDKISQESFDKKESIEDVYAYDIKFMQGENEIQPGASVKVYISKPEIEPNQSASVYHIDDNNNIEDMNSQVDENGDVVFNTTHFSTYVIVNEGDGTIKVTVEHYDISNEAEPQKIYEDDVFPSLKVGDTVNNYAKATNWNVEKVEVNGQIYNEESEYENLELTQDNSIVKVFYLPKETYLRGETTFYDYTVKAGKEYDKRKR